ncbi:MAG: acetyl-CoA carboxylase, carboxyltransferase subunit beta [Pseudomonadota bacterium]
MNWITDYVRPKLDLFSRRTMPENLWVKDPQSGEMVFHADLEANHFVVPASGYHLAIRAEERIKRLMDDGNFEKLPQPEVPVDPLKFRDERRYTDKLKENRNKTGEQDTIFAAVGRIHGQHVTVCVQDFKFMGGSLGMAAGEAIIKSMETAVSRKTPYILFAASGGARMQEGILSLMQLPRTTVAVQMLKEAGLPYIVVLTNPTTGGVSASYAMLGDIHIAEPGALIGFAGPRVIEQTIREKLPEGFQRAEYLQEHGMVDMVVPRPQHRDTLGNLLSILMRTEQIKPAAADKTDESDHAEETAPVVSESLAEPVQDEAAARVADAPENVVASAEANASASDDVVSTDALDGKPAPA